MEFLWKVILIVDTQKIASKTNEPSSYKWAILAQLKTSKHQLKQVLKISLRLHLINYSFEQNGNLMQQNF